MNAKVSVVAGAQGRGSLAQQLVSEGLLTSEQVANAISASAQENIPLAVFLSQQKIISARQIAACASRCFHLPLYDISSYDIKHFPQLLVHLIRDKKSYAMPIWQRQDKIVLAVVSQDLPEIQALVETIGGDVDYVIVEADQLQVMIDAVIARQQFADDAKASPDAEYQFVAGDASKNAAMHLDNHGNGDDDQTPIVSFVSKIIKEAVVSKASDIHFEPYDKTYRVRYRQDGVLYEVAKPPISQAITIVARLKVIANLDISEHRVPQDGRFKMNIPKIGDVDFRISTCPTMYGEKVVLRILDSASTALTPQDLGMHAAQEEAFVHAIAQSQGMILVTGPTGSGKTVTLYSALRQLNTPEKNISTIEDPVEIYMEGVNQVQVNVKTGMTFAATLRSFLRQDPDIMMVGEIRDSETAEIAIKAAQTGHLVLSTLHTNSATLTITRLLNMGVKPFDMTGSVILIVAQRLVRKLCPHCKVPIAKGDSHYAKISRFIEGEEVILFNKDDQPEEHVSDLQDAKIYTAGRCDQCTDGYKGRTGLFEVLTISDEMAQLIIDGASAVELACQARQEGILSMRDSGIRKIKEGITSFEEVARVIEL